MGSGPSLPEGKERSRGQAERKAMTGNTSGIHVQAACLLFCVRRTHRVSAYKCVCLFSHSIALPHPKQAAAREHSNPAPDNTHRAKGGQGIYIAPNEPFQAGQGRWEDPAHVWPLLLQRLEGRSTNNLVSLQHRLVVGATAVHAPLKGVRTPLRGAWTRRENPCSYDMI